MDRPLPREQARRALRDLDRVNRLLLGAAAVRRAVLPRLLGGRPSGPPFDLLDVGSGSGSITADLARAAARRGVRVRTVAVDRRLGHLAIGRALGAGREGPLRVVADAEALPFRDGAFAWTLSHLLFHHFGGDGNRRIVGEMRRCAAGGAVIVDLRRSRLALRLAQLLFPLLGIGEIARTDGELSVRQAWTVDEVRGLAEEAGWRVVELRLRFPFRWSLVVRAEGRSPGR